MQRLMDLAWLGTEPQTAAERFLCHALEVADQAGARLWLRGGYAMDALVGRPLREHADVDLFIALADWPRLRPALDVPPYQVEYVPPSVARIHSGETCLADILLTEEHPLGFPFIRAPLGANPLPPGSLTEGPTVTIWGRIARVVTLECMFVMKASGNFTAEPGDPLRPKDEEDLKWIQSILPARRLQDLGRYCVIYPAP
jgi:hypothetical protein